MMALKGIPSRFPPAALQAASYLSYDAGPSYRQGSCFLVQDQEFSRFDRSTCLTPVPGKVNILLFGDSQAAQLWYGLARIFPEIHFLQATASACTLFVDQPRGNLAGCRELSDYMHGQFLGHTHIDAVLLSGRWRPEQIAALTEQITWITQRGIPVYLVGPGMEYDLPLPRLLGMDLRYGKPNLLAIHWDAEARETDDRFKVLARETWKVPYISMFDDLCTPQCPVYGAPGVPIFFDGHHFTEEGSLLFARAVRERQQLPLGPGAVVKTIAELQGSPK